MALLSIVSETKLSILQYACVDIWSRFTQQLPNLLAVYISCNRRSIFHIILPGKLLQLSKLSRVFDHEQLVSNPAMFLLRHCEIQCFCDWEHCPHEPEPVPVGSQMAQWSPLPLWDRLKSGFLQGWPVVQDPTKEHTHTPPPAQG